MILAFDTETTGLIEPRLVELGAVLLDQDGAERAVVSLIVRPTGFKVPSEATAVHGISHDRAVSLGVPSVVALSALTNLWSLASVRIAFNLEYDDGVIERELRSLGRTSSLKRPRGVCVKELAAPVLNLPATERMIATGYGDKPKPPSLNEAYRFLFDEDVPGAHGALADARAAARVYVELLRRGEKVA